MRAAIFHQLGKTTALSQAYLHGYSWCVAVLILYFRPHLQSSVFYFILRKLWLLLLLRGWDCICGNGFLTGPMSNPQMTHQWIWGNGGKILTGENQRTRRKTWPSAILSTVNYTRTDPCEKPGKNLCTDIIKVPISIGYSSYRLHINSYEHGDAANLRDYIWQVLLNNAQKCIGVPVIINLKFCLSLPRN